LKLEYRSQEENLRRAILARFPSLSAGADFERNPVEGVNAIGPQVTHCRSSIATEVKSRLRAKREFHKELFFRVSVILKGLDALLEFEVGLALLAVSPRFTLRMVRACTQNEFAEDPQDLVANLLRHARAAFH